MRACFLLTVLLFLFSVDSLNQNARRIDKHNAVVQSDHPIRSRQKGIAACLYNNLVPKDVNQARLAHVGKSYDSHTYLLLLFLFGKLTGILEQEGHELLDSFLLQALRLLFAFHCLIIFGRSFIELIALEGDHQQLLRFVVFLPGFQIFFGYQIYFVYHKYQLLTFFLDKIFDLLATCALGVTGIEDLHNDI